MLSSWQTPLLKNFVQMSTKLLGLTPNTLIQRSEYIYRHVTQGLGTLAVEPGANSATVVVRGFPAKLFDFDCYVDGTHGCIRSIFAITQAMDTVEVAQIDRKNGDVRYAVRWAETQGAQ